jgi:plasmid stabilization system protein ParE
MKPSSIIWSQQAIDSLNSIFEYHRTQSEQGAQTIRRELLQAPRAIQFAHQYQLDDINPKYRRVVVRDYKVLYLEVSGVIQIVDIISSRQSPQRLMDL